MTRTLDQKQWNHLYRTVPIPWVTLLTYRRGKNGCLKDIGFAWLRTPYAGPGLSLIGGPLLIHESLEEATRRYLYTYLGDDVRFKLPDLVQPVYVAEYFPEAREGRLHDPMKHAICLVVMAEITSPIVYGADAEDFDWFSPKEVQEIGSDILFGHALVVERCLERFECG